MTPLVLLALLAVELFSVLLVARLLLVAVVAPGGRVVAPGSQTQPEGVVAPKHAGYYTARW